MHADTRDQTLCQRSCDGGYCIAADQWPRPICEGYRVIALLPDWCTSVTLCALTTALARNFLSPALHPKHVKSSVSFKRMLVRLFNLLSQTLLLPLILTPQH